MIKLLNTGPANKSASVLRSSVPVFSINAVGNLLLLYITNRYLVTYAAFERSWSDRLNSDQLSAYFLQKDHIALINLFLLVVYLLLKYAIISFILSVAARFCRVEITFRQLLKVVMIAELIFLFSQAYRIAHFLGDATFTLDDLRSYEPLSFAAILHYNNTGPLQFALQTINLWEVIYCVVLADGIRQLSGASWRPAIRVVMSGYVASLVFWLITLSFTTYILQQ
jgi:hypothetical protein